MRFILHLVCVYLVYLIFIIPFTSTDMGVSFYLLDWHHMQVYNLVAMAIKNFQKRNSVLSSTSESGVSAQEILSRHKESSRPMVMRCLSIVQFGRWCVKSVEKIFLFMGGTFTHNNTQNERKMPSKQCFSFTQFQPKGKQQQSVLHSTYNG